MKKKLSALLTAGVLTVLIAFSVGCYSTPEGRMRPGIPFAKDSIENRYQRPPDQAFAAAKEVLKLNGTLYGENTISKTLEAQIDTRRVWVAVDEVEPGVTRVRVQARKKGGSADIDLCSEIATQIALKLPR
jgi:hypothetical protein